MSTSPRSGVKTPLSRLRGALLRGLLGGALVSGALLFAAPAAAQSCPPANQAPLGGYDRNCNKIPRSEGVSK